MYNGLLIAFGLGIWGTKSEQVAMHVTGALLIVFGIQGVVGIHFPVHSRGDETTMTTTDIMQIIFTIVSVLLILLFIGFGAFTHRTGFRWYSIGTIFVIVLFGVLGGLQGPGIAEGLPTPYPGVIERANIYASMLWEMEFALVRLRTEQRQDKK